MIITSDSSEKGSRTKQETDNSKLSKRPSTSTRQWSAFRNPRIVHVSQSFGGKDRHSKVCTVRGLRDRRIRLSVPTAIQLYDLQDRLRLSQPSKVIDWLIDATKEDIDKLPPLQFPPGFGTQLFYNYQHMLPPHHDRSFAPFLEPQETTNSERFNSSLGIKINNGIELQEHNSSTRSSRFWEIDATLKLKNKEVENFIDKGKWIKSSSNHEEENQNHHQINHSSLPAGLFFNNPVPATFNFNYQFDNSLSGRQHGMPSYLSSQPELSINCNAAVSFPMPSSGPRLFFCQPTTLPSLFPAYHPYQGTDSADSESRETIHRLQINSIGLQQGLTGNSNSKSVAANYPRFVDSENYMDQSQQEDRR